MGSKNTSIESSFLCYATHVYCHAHLPMQPCLFMHIKVEIDMIMATTSSPLETTPAITNTVVSAVDMVLLVGNVV